MMRMALEGIGLATPLGHSLDALRQAALRSFSGEPMLFPETETDTEPLKNYLPVRALRRVDHFTRMTLLAAFQTVEDAGLSPADLKDAGIVLATGYGPAKLTFDFLDSIIDYGPNMASPLAFSHSVHNIPAATVALKMHINGPCFTVSQFETSVAAAFLSAQTWMAEGRVTRVLVGAVDESTELLQKNTSRISRELSSKASEGRRTNIPGEGAVFFCLHADPTRARYGFIEELSLSRGNTKISDVMPTFFSGAASQKRRDAMPATLHDFSSVYGNLPTAMALDIVLAACALSGKFFPHISSTDGIRCLSRDRFGTLGGLTVTPLEIS